MIRHDNEESQVLSSDKGRLQIYNITMNELIEDLYYKQLYISLVLI